MKLAFRVDASGTIGLGHVMRCLTLAESLSKIDAQVEFICREHPGNLIGLLTGLSYPVKALPESGNSHESSSARYASWLGATLHQDAQETIEALGAEKPDWLVVDHYAIDIEWEQLLKPHCGQLMVIDDLANRFHDCDLLLDQNYSRDGESRYAEWLANSPRLLIGSDFALLNSEYRKLRKLMPSRTGIVRRVLVFFGGTDRQNLSGMTLDALSHPDLKHLLVDVVVGANNPHRALLEQQAGSRTGITLHEFQPGLAELIMQADMAIGAGGTTTWERMCLGLPSLIVLIAENQRPSTESLANDGLVSFLGNADDVDSECIAEAVLEMISVDFPLAELSERNQLLIDGFGTLRVRETMIPTGIDEIRLQAADPGDMAIYFNWANDMIARENSFNSDPISWAEHKDWFVGKLNSPKSHLYVLYARELPVGQVRFDLEGEDVKIDYSLDKIVRGRGWGTRLLLLGMKQLEALKPLSLVAEVKTANHASRSVFDRLGFSVVKTDRDYIVFRLDHG